MSPIGQKLFVAMTVIGSVTLFGSAFAFDFEPKMTEREAHWLAAVAYYGKYADTEVKSFDYDSDDPENGHDFYQYQILGPFGGSSDFVAVNARTGDVWSLWECKKKSTPQSRHLQAKIKKRFSPEELKSYRKISALKPECAGE